MTQRKASQIAREPYSVNGHQGRLSSDQKHSPHTAGRAARIGGNGQDLPRRRGFRRSQPREREDLGLPSRFASTAAPLDMYCRKMLDHPHHNPCADKPLPTPQNHIVCPCFWREFSQLNTARPIVPLCGQQPNFVTTMLEPNTGESLTFEHHARLLGLEGLVSKRHHSSDQQSAPIIRPVDPVSAFHQPDVSELPILVHDVRLKSFCISGAVSSSVALQVRHGAPAAPQPHV
jgi:hypothetical protein